MDVQDDETPEGPLNTRLIEVIVDAEMESVDRPHIVICRDSECGLISFTGPFDSALAAMAEAQREQDLEASAGPAAMTFEVAPLGRPFEA